MPPPLVFHPVIRKLTALAFHPRLWRFALVGLSGVVVNLALLRLLWRGAGLDYAMASAGAIEASILWNFLLNNAWTFADKNESAAAGFWMRALNYAVIAHVGGGVQWVVGKGVVWMVVGDLADPGPLGYIGQLVGIGAAMAWNFTLNFFWTWRSRPAAAPPPAQTPSVGPPSSSHPGPQGVAPSSPSSGSGSPFVG